MKNILLLFIFLITLTVKGQTFEWAKGIGTIGDGDCGTGITKDHSGNTYVTGYFHGTTRFDNTTTLTAVRGKNAFLSKYNSNGDLLWIRQGKGYSGTDNIASDSTGIYIVGDYGDTLTLDGGNNNDIKLPLSGTYIAKYDFSGNLLWAYRGVGSGNTNIMRINSDRDGSVTVIGNFERYITLNGASGAITLHTPDNNSFAMFIAKYDNSGNILWAKQAGATCPVPCGWGGDANMARVKAVSTDMNDNIFIVGTIVGTVNFNSSTAISSDTMGNIYYAKYDKNGDLLWVKLMASTEWNDQPADIKNDKFGNFYLIGRIVSNGKIFLKKFDNNGDQLFSNFYSSTLGLGITSIEISAENNVFLTGGFKGTLILDDKTLESEKGDFLLLKLSASGTVLSSCRTRKSSEGGVGGLALVVDANENSYVTGFFQASVTFGTSSFTGDVYGQILITKIKAAEVIGIKDNTINSSFSIYPNPSGNLVNLSYKGTLEQNFNISINNQLGQNVFTKQYTSQKEITDSFNFSNLSKGIYFVSIKADNINEVRKIVIE